MKKLVILSVIIFLAGINNLKAQEHNQTNLLPIPSFGVQISGKAVFQELSNAGGNTKERRQLNIKTSATTHGMTTGDATVWVVEGLGEVVLGPYQVAFGETLSVSVDSGQWGAIVQTNKEVSVDVWFGNIQFN